MSNDLSAIYLTGTFDFSGTTLNNSVEDVSYIVEFLNQQRADDTTILAVQNEPTYYIELSGNINAFVDVCSNGGGVEDDAWSFRGISANVDISLATLSSNITLSDLNDGDGVDFSFAITAPDISASVNVGKVSYELSGNIGDPYITITGLGDKTSFSSGTPQEVTYNVKAILNEDGTLSFEETAYTNEDNIASISVSEVTSYQQVLYASVWDGLNYSRGDNNPEPDGTGSDILSVDIPDGSLNNSSEITSLLGDVSGHPIITRMVLTVDAIDVSNGNSLSRWAHANNYDGSQNSNLFEEGQPIWVKLSSSFTKSVELKMKKYDGTYTNESDESLTTSFGIKLVQSATDANTGSNEDADQAAQE